jgi:phosphonatase-like hydrolase
MDRKYDLVVFDLAGTTVYDVGDVVAVSLARALRDLAGIEVTVREVNVVMGIAKPKAIEHLLREAQVDHCASRVDLIHRHFVRTMIEHYRTSPTVREMPGTTAAFQALRARGVRVTLDTGFSRDITDTILGRLGWPAEGLVDASITSDEVPQGRPAPFMIHRLMERFGVSDVRRVVKVGDTPSDLHEGTNAGCGRVVGVCNGSHSRAQLIVHPHTDIIAGVADLPETLDASPIPPIRLHTPGPANTSPTVRQAMNRDIGAWDRELIDVSVGIRTDLLALAGVDPARFDCVLMQGSGTFGIEATLGTAVPRGGTLMVARNGAYGDRMVAMAQRLGIEIIDLKSDESRPIDPCAVADLLQRNPNVTTLATVHCETTTGVMNDIEAIGQAVREIRPDIDYIVDAMSSFGADPIDFDAACIDWLVSSSNKCLQGVPGLSFTIVRTNSLNACSARARSLSLDLFDQWKGFASHGRFRYTPPTHVLLAMRQAIDELKRETIPARHARYALLRDRLIDGMAQLGFDAYIPARHRSVIITTFLYPRSPRFGFDAFYQALQARGFVIYPGKLGAVDCFRIGHLGDLAVRDIDDLLVAVTDACVELGIRSEGLSVTVESNRVVSEVASR